MTTAHGLKRAAGAIQGVGRTFLGHVESATDAVSCDFGSFAAPAAGLMVVTIAWRRSSGGATYSDLTIGGVSVGANLVGFTGSTSLGRLLGWRAVAAGSHAVVVSSTANAFHAVGAGVWLLTGLLSDTPHDAPAFVTATSVAATLDVPANGCAIIGANAAADEAVTWTNATEEFDVNMDSTPANRFSSAFVQPSALQSGLVVTATGSSSVARAAVAASWR
jgi:hypothetical protein